VISHGLEISPEIS